MNRFVVFCMVFCMSALCVLAQDQQKENLEATPKPQQIGQFFCLKDGKLIPLHEETDVSASVHIGLLSGNKGDISIKIKGAESKGTLDSADKLTFVVHLPDKSIGHYSLYSLKKEKDNRTMRVGDTAQTVLFLAVEYADGYFQITPKTTLSPGQYVFFFMQAADSVDHFYSFGVK